MNNNIINCKSIITKPPLNCGPNSKILREYKLSLNILSSIQREASIGLMLGDVSLQTQNKGKTYRMKFEWGNKDKPYVDHIHNLFYEWILSPPHKKSRINVHGNVVINWGFQTISHTAFNYLKDLFLVNNNKGIVPNLIKDHLTGRGLAYWFMDDGGKLDYNKNTINKGLVLNTHGFSKEEVEMISIELNDKFDLNTVIRMNKNKYIIVIKSDKYDKFMDLIYEYILPHMRYKLPL